MRDDALIPEPADQTLPVQRDPFSDEGKRHIFELWAFRCGRNAAEVARILKHEYDVEITDRVIRKWATNEAWGDRANEELEALAPNLYAGIVTDLLHGAQAGANYLRRAASGDPSALVKGRVDMGRVSAANIALQAAGFSPRQMKEAGQLQIPKQASNELAEFASAAEANRHWISGGQQE